ncbi:IdeS/Mac family cysteine endopeptidase [Streptococcus suis]|uniref:IdeS/Mac family cysteine endopeptidase n=8 Tax=Streptococcus suis TaxID=1307 RepID=UPI0037DA1454
MNIQERFSLRKSAVGLVSVSLLCAIYTSTVAADTVVTGMNEIIEESQVKDEASIESEKNKSLEGSNLEIVEEIADNIPSPVIAEGEVAVEMKVDGGTENVVSRNDKEVTTSEQNQIEVTETKEILNQTSYQTESSEQRQIVWAHGITPPVMEQSGGFVKEKYGDYLNYTAPFEAGKGYYDTNKSLNASFIDLNLCFAAVSSNMVHWWLEQNSSYVERYLKEKNSTVNVGENYAITDLRRYIDSFQDQQNSRVFDMFKTYYGYRTNGFVSDALVDLFINGYKPKVQGGVNLEDSQLVPDSRGGFFYDVFKEKKLTNRLFSGSYERFGEDVRTVLESKGLLGLTYRTLGYATHIVTVWGAEYDNQGKIRAVYITDSDDQQEQIGLKRMGITRDASGNPRLNNHVKNNSAGALLDYVHTIRLGQDLWEEYFNPLAKAKETASQTLADTKKALDLSIQGQSELPESMRLIYLEKLNNLYNQGILSIQKAESSEMLSGALENGLNSLKSLDFPISKVGNALAPDLPVGNRSTVSDVDSLSSQETSSTNLEVDPENASLIADGTNQLHFPVEVQTTSSVEAEGDNVFEQEADTLPIIIENKDEFGSELSRNMQTSETDSLVVVVEEDVKNDEVVPVEELLESETVESQRSELLSGPIGMEEVNVKEETQVAPVVTEQPATSKTTTVEASFDESASVESETVAQPAPTSSPGRSALPVQPEVTEVASQEEDQVATTATEQPATSKTTTVEASLDEPASVESETVAQPAPTSSPGRSAIPVQPEVTEVASQEEDQVATTVTEQPATSKTTTVEASLDEPASAESETVAQPAPTSSPGRSAIPVQPEVTEVASQEEDQVATTVTEQSATAKTLTVESSDEPVGVESETVVKTELTSSPGRSALPVQPEVTEVASQEETQVATTATEQPATSKTTTVEASFDESASVESETVAQPAPTSSPGRSALPVQPEVTEVASQEEDQVATTATEQPATSKTTTVEASLDEPASVESETVAQPAPTSSPGRSALPVQPEVTEVASQEETQVATTVTEQSATAKTLTVESSDEPVGVESETVVKTELTSSPGRSALPVQPEVTEVASQEEDQVATTATEQPATSKTTTVEASLDEPASAESETVAQPAPTSSPGRSAIPVQPEVTEVASQEEDQVATTVTEQSATAKTLTVESSDEPVGVESETVVKTELTSSPGRSALPVQPEVTEVASQEETQVATTVTEQPATAKTLTVESSDEPVGVESETVAKPAPTSSPGRSAIPVQPEVASQEETQVATTATEQPATAKTLTVESSDEPVGVESETVAKPAPTSSPGRSAIPVQPEVASQEETQVATTVTEQPATAKTLTVESSDEPVGVESESVAKNEATLVPVAEDIPVLPGHSAIRVAESVAKLSTISEKNKFVDAEVSSTLKVDSEEVANESNAPQIEFLTEATTESILAEADSSSILTGTKVTQPNKLMSDLESTERILVPESRLLANVKIGISSQEIVLPEVPEREPQMSSIEMDKGYKETDLDESAEPKVINNTRKYVQNSAAHSKIDTKQVLSVEQSSTTMTNASGKIVGISLLTLVLGSVWALLKKASKKQ